MLHFLRARAVHGMEVIENERYFRSVSIDDLAGSVEVGHLLPKAMPCGGDPILASDAQLAPLVEQGPGLRAPGGWDGFEIAVRTVLGRQNQCYRRAWACGQTSMSFYGDT